MQRIDRIINEWTAANGFRYKLVSHDDLCFAVWWKHPRENHWFKETDFLVLTRRIAELTKINEIATNKLKKESTKEILDLKDASNYLRISRATMFRLLKSTDVPKKKVAGQWRFFRRALLLWIEKGD